MQKQSELCVSDKIYNINMLTYILIHVCIYQYIYIYIYMFEFKPAHIRTMDNRTISNIIDWEFIL